MKTKMQTRTRQGKKKTHIFVFNYKDIFPFHLNFCLFFHFYLKILPLVKSTKIKNFKIVLKLSSLLSIVEIGFCSSFVCCTSFNFQFLFQRSVGSRTHGSAFSAHPFGPTVPYGCSSPNRQRVLPCHSLSLSL